jgi:7-cyano-7-deazaguanine synthase in queuosine biosynthesis
LSHYPAPALRGIQKRLEETLRARHPRLINVSVPVSAAGKLSDSDNLLGQPPKQVLYQHGRSFLFLALASTLAIQNGIADIYVHENGPISLNPTFSEARFNTRTTHPVFVEYFRELLRRVFGVELRINSSFANLTKGEILDGLDSEWVEHLRKTNSCWSYSKVRLWAGQMDIRDFTGGHCGRCLPCLARRAAFHHAKLDSADDSYLWDAVPAHKWSKWLDTRHFTPILDQFRFCQNALVMPDSALLDFCPDFYDDNEEKVREKLALYRRFAGEMVAWFELNADQFSLARTDE